MLTNSGCLCIIIPVAERHSDAEMKIKANGSIAQLGEHMPYKHGVTGSSPVVPTTYLARWCSRLARQPVTLEVDGSSPFRVAIYNLIEMSNRLNMPL